MPKLPSAATPRDEATCQVPSQFPSQIRPAYIRIRLPAVATQLTNTGGLGVLARLRSLAGGCAGWEGVAGWERGRAWVVSGWRRFGGCVVEVRGL
jgi:hypothetical protein